MKVMEQNKTIPTQSQNTADSEQLNSKVTAKLFNMGTLFSRKQFTNIIF